MMNRVTRKFSSLVGPTVLGHPDWDGLAFVKAADRRKVTIRNPQKSQDVQHPFDPLIYERAMLERLKLEDPALYLEEDIPSPLPRVYNLDLDGAWPYLCLLVAVLWAVGGWFVWVCWK